MFFVAVNTHVHTPRKKKITQPLSFVIDKIWPQVTLGLFPPHPWPLRQQVVLPVPTTLLPQRPRIECFLWPSTHLVGLATMPITWAWLSGWGSILDSSWVFIHLPKQIHDHLGGRKEDPWGLFLLVGRLCGASMPQGWSKLFRVINVCSLEVYAQYWPGGNHSNWN